MGEALKQQGTTGFETFSVKPSLRLAESAVVEDPEISKKRAELIKDLESRGEILSPEHEFTKLVASVAHKLGLPENIEVITIDSEALECFYAQKINIICVGRGVCRQFIDTGLDVAEDHIAAVLAHEIEHAAVMGKEYDEKITQPFDQRLAGLQTHSEEYRADSQSLRRLAHAGYNPRAIIDALRTFTLTSGRGTLSHPEMIDRIRKLEDRLADDEHPISHTSKPYTPVDSDLRTWMGEDSPYYERMDEFIHEDEQALIKSLLESRNQKEFWQLYTMIGHLRRISKAKNFVGSNPEIAQRMLAKRLVSDRILSGTIYVGGKHVDTQQGILLKPFEKLRENKSIESIIADKFDDFSTIEPKRQYKSTITPDSQCSEGEAKWLEAKAGIGDVAIKKFFAEIEDVWLNDEEREYYAKLKKLYESGEVTKELMEDSFEEHTAKRVDEIHKAYTQIHKDGGRRLVDNYKPLVIDFDDPEELQRRLRDLEESLITNNLQEDFEQSDAVASYLAQLVEADTGMDGESCGVIAKILVFRLPVQGLIDHLKTKENEELIQLAEQIQRLSWDGIPFAGSVSPIRTLHDSFYKSARYTNLPNIPQPTYNELPIDAAGVKTIKMLPAHILWTRKNILDERGKANAEESTLTLDEWDAVVSGNGTDGALFYFQEFLVKTYANSLLKGEKPDPEIVRRIESSPTTSLLKPLSAEQAEMLIDNPLWDPTKTQEIIYRAIRDIPREDDLDVWEKTAEDRKKYIRILKKAYKLASENPVIRQVDDFAPATLTPNQISGHIFELLINRNNRDCFIIAVGDVKREDRVLSYQDLSSEFRDFFISYSDGSMEKMIGILEKRDSANQDEFLSMLKLKKIMSDKIDYYRDKDIVKKVTQCPYDPQVAERLTEAEGGRAQAVGWVVANLRPSALRDRLLINIVKNTPFENSVRDEIVTNPDQQPSRSNPYFSPFGYGRDERRLRQRGGLLQDTFDDLLTRRYDFRLLAPENFDASDSNSRNDGGSAFQSFEASKLYSAEGTIFAENIVLEQRLEAMVDVAPKPSVVRDIYLEAIARNELANSTDQEIIEKGQVILSYLSANSKLRDNIVLPIMRSELKSCPELLMDREEMLRKLNFYFPSACLAKNHYLDLLEQSVSLTSEQMQEILALRISEEGKKENGDSAPATFIINQLSELNRSEKSSIILWLLGLTEEKPINIKKAEEDLDGHLDNMPKVVMGMLPNERAILFKRLLLGAEGVVDLEAVPDEQMKDAERERREFLESLADSIVPESTANRDFAKKLFTSIIEWSDPAHASRLLTKLINAIAEKKEKGEILTIEELSALALSELGVVGKKVAQSLAEFEWVPESFRLALNKSQSQGEIVPKRALYELAEDAGLLDGNSPIRIVSFDELKGAASNKQACLLTVEVANESYGLPVGRHQVIGKFKRPSAQKVENINHDIMILERVVDLLDQEGQSGTLPADFTDQIKDATTRELDFDREKEFSERLRAEVERRNKSRKLKIKIPEIYFTSDDLMIEQLANGITFREFQDRFKDANPLDRHLREKLIKEAVIAEALAQLINTGNVHADLHPGNIMVDNEGSVTIIDLGMHEKLDRTQRLDTIALLSGLFRGDQAYVKKSLRKMGWDINGTNLDLKAMSLESNAVSLLNAMHQSKSSVPEHLISVIIAISKLSTYSKGFKNSELARILISSIDPKEVPSIAAHLLRVGM